MAALWSNHIDTTTIQIFKTIPKKKRNLQTQKKTKPESKCSACMYFDSLSFERDSFSAPDTYLAYATTKKNYSSYVITIISLIYLT
ncbi:hypothetical protein DERP_007305 [Dermatophagoides pteronyssinus]|uniref:Uncharacterized protein n=1 Tax=Dermatophagoides pteronyssinus TaxID=6956 RepID=A0ABQ8J3Z3_DERPT|nr:hypothetical protein DERP_007305 [Dermatophagoides pteronyssinus]